MMRFYLSVDPPMIVSVRVIQSASFSEFVAIRHRHFSKAHPPRLFVCPNLLAADLVVYMLVRTTTAFSPKIGGLPEAFPFPPPK